MQARIIHRFDAFERAIGLAKDHPVPVPRVTTLVNALEPIVMEIRRYAGEQDFGHATFRGGSSIRAHHAAELRALLRSVNRIALALDPEEFPGLREKLKMPRGDGYERLRARASAFINAAEPLRSAFIERGLDPDFIEQIAARQGEMLAALTIKNNGRSLQIGGTAGLAALVRRGMQILRELDAILTHQYRGNPSLLAAWKSAARVQRDPQRREGSEELDVTAPQRIEPISPPGESAITRAPTTVPAPPVNAQSFPLTPRPNPTAAPFTRVPRSD